MKNVLWIRKTGLLALSLAVTGCIEAAVVNLNPTADALVTTGPANNLATNNYGGGGSLGLSAAGLAKGEFQSVLRFDTSSAKTTFDTLYGAGQWSLQSVTLQLSAGANNNALYNANAAGSFNASWLGNDSWTEGTGTPGTPTQNGITYNTLLGTYINGLADEALGSFSYNGTSSGTFTYSLNLTSGFSADLLGGNLTSLRLFAADAAVSYLFSSRSFGTPANWPVLSITAVPEPGTVGIFALAGTILLAGARKRWRS
jgi:hypothetical protein